MKHILSIAGTDPTGGAGAMADCKTICAHGCYAMNVITAVVAQNTQGVQGYMDVPPELIRAQLQAVFDDVAVDAVKIGMVSVINTIEAVAQTLEEYKTPVVVVDPVMVSSSGHRLLAAEAEQALRQRLLKLATIVTPNIPEAEVLTGKKIKTLADMEKAAEQIADFGPQAVLVKGGHRIEDATDILFDGKKMYHFPGIHVNSMSTHGTGCSLSSAIASNAAKGMTLCQAVEEAKQYVLDGIVHAESIGKGHGPIHHFYKLYHDAGME